MLRKLPILIFAVSAIAAAEISLGVDMNYTVNKNTDEDEIETVNGSVDDKRENTLSTLSITPVLGIHANKIVEISPILGYHD